MHRLRCARFTLLGFCLGLSSCVFFRSAKVPMPFEKHHSVQPEKVKHLVLFLPGLGDKPKDVVKGGLLSEIKQAPQFDAIIADAHFGYYRGFTVVQRLHKDIIAPIRNKYDEFWIVGNSMGGYGATAYAEAHPENVTGIVLLAPYLGQSDVMEDIEASGSLKKWQPQNFETDSERTQHGVTLWSWLKERPQHPDQPYVFLGSGDKDEHMRALKLLRPVLPPSRVRVIPGKHDWKTWKSLFHEVVTNELSHR